jgi:hypothetical protein
MHNAGDFSFGSQTSALSGGMPNIFCGRMQSRSFCQLGL